MQEKKPRDFDKRGFSYPPWIASSCSSVFCSVQNVVDKVKVLSVVTGPSSVVSANFATTDNGPRTSKFSSASAAEDGEIGMRHAAATTEFLLGLRGVAAILRRGGDQQDHEDGRHEKNEKWRKNPENVQRRVEHAKHYR
jgi:hypothetical protein